LSVIRRVNREQGVPIGHRDNAVTIPYRVGNEWSEVYRDMAITTYRPGVEIRGVPLRYIHTETLHAFHGGSDRD
jgi:hypothetical protein